MFVNSCHSTINPFVRNGLSYLNALDGSDSSRRDVWLFLVLQCFTEISVFNANSVDPDQTPHSAASDLGLHCLPMSLLWNLGINGFSILFIILLISFHKFTLDFKVDFLLLFSRETTSVTCCLLSCMPIPF